MSRRLRSHPPPIEDVDKYNVAREVFLRRLDRSRMTWHPTDQNHDTNVEVSRIFTRNPHEYLVLMRVRPRGFRAPRKVASDVKLVFHLILGSVVFNCRDKDRVLERGDCISVPPKGRYAIKSNDPNVTAVFVLQYIDLGERRKERGISQQMIDTTTSPEAQPPSQEDSQSRETIIIN